MHLDVLLEKKRGDGDPNRENLKDIEDKLISIINSISEDNDFRVLIYELLHTLILQYHKYTGLEIIKKENKLLSFLPSVSSLHDTLNAIVARYVKVIKSPADNPLFYLYAPLLNVDKRSKYRIEDGRIPAIIIVDGLARVATIVVGKKKEEEILPPYAGLGDLLEVIKEDVSEEVYKILEGDIYDTLDKVLKEDWEFDKYKLIYLKAYKDYEGKLDENIRKRGLKILEGTIQDFLYAVYIGTPTDTQKVKSHKEFYKKIEEAFKTVITLYKDSYIATGKEYYPSKPSEVKEGPNIYI